MKICFPEACRVSTTIRVIWGCLREITKRHNKRLVSWGSNNCKQSEGSGDFSLLLLEKIVWLASVSEVQAKPIVRQKSFSQPVGYTDNMTLNKRTPEDFERWI